MSFPAVGRALRLPSRGGCFCHLHPPFARLQPERHLFGRRCARPTPLFTMVELGGGSRPPGAMARQKPPPCRRLQSQSREDAALVFAIAPGGRDPPPSSTNVESGVQSRTAAYPNESCSKKKKHRKFHRLALVRSHAVASASFRSTFLRRFQREASPVVAERRHLSRITASRSPRATWIFSPAAASWT